VRGVAAALGATVVAAREVDHRGRHAEIDVPVVTTGVPGWPSWLDGWREYTEVLAARRVARAAMRIHSGEPISLVWERHALFSDAGWKVSAATGADWILEVNAPLALERERFETLRRPAWARAWERDVLLAAPRVIAVSAWLRDWLRSLGCRDVRHVPNGVVPRVGDREGTRREFGLEGRFVLGFLGSHKPWHGVDRIPAILDAIPDAVCLMVGDGPARASHPRMVSVGQVDEARAADLVAAMDVGLAPYGPDAPPWFCPLKILAYRAQGTPVVAADVGDCRMLVGEGGTVGEDFVDAIGHWRGRRAAPWVRSWADVVAEAIA
jgi:glycosyltransferase involved in cell wall biosynthesis